MKKFEYKTLTLEVHDRDDNESLLNSLGAQGWQIVGTSHYHHISGYTVNQDWVFIILMREVNASDS